MSSNRLPHGPRPPRDPRPSTRSPILTGRRLGPLLLGLSLCGLLGALSVPAHGASRTQPARPDQVHKHLEIGPIAGLTTAWHPAPRATAVPLGTPLRFRVRAPSGLSVDWTGAREVERSTAWSVAEVTPTAAGPLQVSVRPREGDPQTFGGSVELDAQPLPPGGLQLSPIAVQGDPLDLSAIPSNPATLRYFFRPGSIARLSEPAPGRFLTSTNRWLALRVEVRPAAFGPLVEWRLDGTAQRFTGDAVRLVLFPARRFDLEAGPPGADAGVLRHASIDTYRVKITSHAPRTSIPEGQPMTFTAVTEPPGYEEEITWMASTKYGIALPLTGRGAEFSTVFLGTTVAGERWLGVRADQAKVSDDLKLAAPNYGEDGLEEPTTVLVRPDRRCDGDDDLTHRLEIQWRIENPRTPKEVEVEVVFGSGETVQLEGGAVGAGSVAVTAPEGDTALVLLRAAPVEDPPGPTGPTLAPRVVARTAAFLPPCDPLAAPEPGAGFGVGETSFAGPGSGIPREVEVASLDGSTAQRRRFVTAVGSGAAFQLTLWESVDGGAPAVLDRSSPLEGFDLRLHTLDGPGGPDEPHPFLVASRRDDGNLWLSLYTVDGGNRLVAHRTIGYGESAGVRVDAYALTHRSSGYGPASNRQLLHQVLTPVRTPSGSLRLVLWRADGGTLALDGVQDSGHQGSTDPDSRLEIADLGGDLFAVSSRKPDGTLASRFWEVRLDGSVPYSVEATSGLEHGGDRGLKEPIQDLALAPLAGGGYVTATGAHPLDSSDLVVWAVERFTGLGRDAYDFYYRTLGLPPPPALATPYRLTDNTEDLTPRTFGVSVGGLPSPVDGFDQTNDDDPSTIIPLTVQAFLTDALWDEAEPGTGELFGVLEDEEAGIASVTKVMTAILTLEADASGDRSLEDLLCVSPGAASIPGSSMDLFPGEIWEVEDLLLGLILESGNDAGQALAEGLRPPFCVLGSGALFVQRMQQKARDLGLDSTEYANSWGSANSTAREQAALLAYGLAEVPRFRDFLSPIRRQVRSDFPFLDRGRSVPLDRPELTYPGVVAFKSGSRGITFDGVQRCGVGACLSGAARRLGRTLIAVVLQSGNIYGDVEEMLEYGFRQQLTPDRRGDDGGQGGDATAFDLVRLGRAETLSAVVHGGHLEVCRWLSDADTGEVDPTVCTREPAPALTPGPEVTRPRVQLVLLTSDVAAGDYLRGFLDGGSLHLDLWRIAPLRRPSGSIIP